MKDQRVKIIYATSIISIITTSVGVAALAMSRDNFTVYYPLLTISYISTMVMAVVAFKMRKKGVTK